YIYKLDYMICTNSLMNRTMATTIEQQVALDDALVPSTKILRIGRSNFRLSSDIQSKESTLQVVYDVLRGCPFFKAFFVTADIPEIYMQEFWATAYVHQYSIRFKIDSKKNIVELETFRDMLHISPRVPGQSFDELPFEEEILDFLRFLRHSAQIKTLTDVNVNKLFHPWRSFAAVFNKCLTGKSFGFDSFSGTQESKEEQRDVLPKIHKSHHPSLHDEETFNPKMKQGTPRLIRSIMLVSLKKQHQSQRLTAAAKRKQPVKAKSPSDSSEVERTEAEQLKIILKRSRQETHISQHGGSKEEISWNSSDDEDVDAQDKDRYNTP
nr:hypothetical protein [Tanacetum cinerariifolium]